MITAKKYRPQLANLLQLCEVNYLLIIRLLADKMAVGECRAFAVAEYTHYQIRINEVTRYTSLITIEQQSSDSPNQATSQRISPLLKPTMVIRLYHDARMAEVISNQAIKHVKPRYDYPNAQMHHPDEKQQISQFLKEWLQLCLTHGRVQQPFLNNDAN